MATVRRWRACSNAIAAALLRFLTRLSRNRTVAEDVAQQTWLKVIDVARQGAFAAASDVAFRTWLCTLARNHFIDEYRRKFAASRSVPLPADLDATLAETHRVAPILRSRSKSGNATCACTTRCYGCRSSSVRWSRCGPMG